MAEHSAGSRRSRKKDVEEQVETPPAEELKQETPPADSPAQPDPSADPPTESEPEIDIVRLYQFRFAETDGRYGVCSGMPFVSGQFIWGDTREEAVTEWLRLYEAGALDETNPNAAQLGMSDLGREPRVEIERGD